MRVKTDFQIYERKHRSGNTGWVVSLGKVKGKRKFRSFCSREQAQAFRAKCLERGVLNSPAELSDMSELGRAEVRLAMEKLKPFETTLNVAVDYYLKFAMPPNGKITIQEAMDLFREVKQGQNKSKKYTDSSYRCVFVPFRDAFQNCLSTDITPDGATRYIYKHESWNGNSKNHHIRHLRALYSFLIKRRYCTLNPFAQVEFVTIPSDDVSSKIVSPANVAALLQYSLDHGYTNECASLVLSFFCGVRADGEVQRVAWEHIQLVGSEPIVDIKVGKKYRRRVNSIPPNAVEWLRLCQGKGQVCRPNHAKRMQRLRKKAKIPYPQNCARHCFASYHIAFCKDANQTAFLLGHRNAALLYSTYRELVSFEEAKAYWNILPAAKAAEKLARDAAEREDYDIIAEQLEQSAGGEIGMEYVWHENNSIAA